MLAAPMRIITSPLLWLSSTFFVLLLACTGEEGTTCFQNDECNGSLICCHLGSPFTQGSCETVENCGIGGMGGDAGAGGMAGIGGAGGAAGMAGVGGAAGAAGAGGAGGAAGMAGAGGAAGAAGMAGAGGAAGAP
jgi:hypothetical protein